MRTAKKKRITRKQITTKNPAQKATARPTPKRCNPHWGRAFVEVSQVREWPELVSRGIATPRTFSAGPGRESERVTIALAEQPYQVDDDRSLTLSIKFFTPMHGWSEARGAITVAQAHSLEEGLRAVFLAAREEGLLPTSGSGSGSEVAA